ncbi:hypothetical protein JCM21900_003929, partial [Sporobolomyces salmonicolor]
MAQLPCSSSKLLPSSHLGLLSDVASSLDPALVDQPATSCSHHPSTSTASSPFSTLVHHPPHLSHAQEGDIPVHGPSTFARTPPHALDGHAQLDASLQQLIAGDGVREHGSGSGSLPQMGGVYDEEETEDEGEPDDERVLEETPADPDLQIQQLRQMDQQADISLAANQAYQNELLTIMKRLDAAKKRTVELQTLVKGMATELLAGADMKIVAPGTVEPALPWFKHKYGKNLPPNSEGEARDRYLSTIRWIPWSPSERALLRQEVMAHNHRAIALQAQATGEDLDDLLASTDPSFFVESVAGLDWDKIALV